MKDYQEKLKDPRWQKKRLEVMNRDNFTCQVCGNGLNNGVPLNVHHIKYKPNADPWEYADNNLLTLCEECHRKAHNGEITLKLPRNNKAGIVYFRYLFKCTDELSPVEGLVYSVLLFNSMVSNGEFARNGTLCIDKVKTYIAATNCEYINYSPMKAIDLMNKTELTFPTVKRALSSLHEKGFIDECRIKCSHEMLNGGYMKIPYGTNLKGRQLFFYSFLLDRSYKHNNTIDTWAYRYKDLCGIDSDNAYFIINQLKNKGLVERLGNGALKIYNPNCSTNAFA